MDENTIQKQRVQRLKVNRVAIIQELRVEHVLPYLSEKGVLSENDVIKIDEGVSPHDKVRILLDLLPQCGRRVNWYGHFRNSLKNPEADFSADTRLKYQILVDFLDNAIIPLPPELAGKEKNPLEGRKLPHYDPLPSISSTSASLPKQTDSRVTFDMDSSVADGEPQEKGMAEGDIPENENKDLTEEEEKQMAAIREQFHRVLCTPENYASLLVAPEEHFTRLGQSDDPDDHKLLEQERAVLEKMQALEAAYALNRRKQVPAGFELCVCQALEDVLEDHSCYHLYFKYLHQLKLNYQINLLGDISAALILFLKKCNARDEEKIGFSLLEMMRQYGMFYQCESLIYAMVSYLMTYQHLDTWMTIWRACTKVMACRNTNVNFNQADTVYHAIQAMGKKIDLMSFGQDLLDCSEIYCELSKMMREQGSLGPAYTWAQQSLHEVESDNHDGIVDMLCNATVAYSVKWNIKKAEQLALQAVRQAKHLFGVNHPNYVKSLIYFCLFSNEFRQDAMGVDIARRAVQICEKIYGGAPCLMTAQSHQVLATALLVNQHNQQTSDTEYMEQALDALRIAMDTVPGDHPRLAPFKYTLAQALCCRAKQASEDERLGLAYWAESQAQGARNTFVAYWGEMSIKSYQANMLLGQIYAVMGRWEEAEQVLQTTLHMQKLGLHPKSNYISLTKATIGFFYSDWNKPAQAIDLLKDVVNNTDCGGVYMKWVHMAYETLISLLRATGQRELADEYIAGLTDWTNRNPQLSSTMTLDNLHQPLVTFEEFRSQFTELAQRAQQAKKELFKMFAAKDSSEMMVPFGNLAGNTGEALLPPVNPAAGDAAGLTDAGSSSDGMMDGCQSSHGNTETFTENRDAEKQVPVTNGMNPSDIQEKDSPSMPYEEKNSTNDLQKNGMVENNKAEDHAKEGSNTNLNNVCKDQENGEFVTCPKEKAEQKRISDAERKSKDVIL